MLVGIKYCGGCRAAYDRGAETKNVIAAAEGEEGPDGQSYEFEYAKEGVHYDTLLVVCGCRTRCPNIRTYDYGHAVYLDEAGAEVKM